MKKVLLTGASYGLGRSALDGLLAQGVEVVAVARNLTHLKDLAAATPLLTLQECDLAHVTPQKATALLIGCDTVWHCAALSAPWGKYEDFYRINVHATEQLLQASGRLGVGCFVHISTPSVYFDFQHRQHIPETFLAAKFANHYVSTKHLAEQALLQAVAQYPQTQYLMLRPRAIFGEYDRVLMPRLLQLHQQGGGVFKLPRAAEVVMDLTYVGNVVHAMALASAAAHIKSGSVFNITNQEPWRLSQVLQHLFGALGKEVRIKKVPYALAQGVAIVAEKWANVSGKEPAFTPYSIGALTFDMVLDNTQAQQVLAYQPVVNMQEAIIKTAAALQISQLRH